MASLSLGPRINARTLPRIHKSIKSHCQQLTDAGCTFEGRAISTESLVSTVMMAYLDLDLKTQLEFIKPAMKLLEQELDATPDFS